MPEKIGVKLCDTPNCGRKADQVQKHGGCCVYCYISDTAITDEEHTVECDKAYRKDNKK